MSTTTRYPCPVCGLLRFSNNPTAPCITCYSLRHMVTPLGDWVDDALCTQVDPEIFYPTHRGGTLRTADSAKLVCAQCDVRLQCLDYSLRAREPYGVWGGLSEVERRHLLDKEAS